MLQEVGRVMQAELAHVMQLTSQNLRAAARHPMDRRLELDDLVGDGVDGGDL